MTKHNRTQGLRVELDMLNFSLNSASYNMTSKCYGIAMQYICKFLGTSYADRLWMSIIDVFNVYASDKQWCMVKGKAFYLWMV